MPSGKTASDEPLPAPSPSGARPRRRACHRRGGCAGRRRRGAARVEELQPAGLRAELFQQRKRTVPRRRPCSQRATRYRSDRRRSSRARQGRGVFAPECSAPCKGEGAHPAGARQGQRTPASRPCRRGAQREGVGAEDGTRPDQIGRRQGHRREEPGGVEQRQAHPAARPSPRRAGRRRAKASASRGSTAEGRAAPLPSLARRAPPSPASEGGHFSLRCAPSLACGGGLGWGLASMPRWTRRGPPPYKPPCAGSPFARCTGSVTTSS